MRRTTSTYALVGLVALVALSCDRAQETEPATQNQLADIQRANLAELEPQIFVLVPEEPVPEDGLPAQRVAIELPDRTLYGTWVSSDPSAPAFFLLHGNGEHIAEWRPLQAYLLGKGYSSFVFDYTGFGSSTGQPTVDRLNQDAVEAYTRFAQLSAEAAELIAFAHSLGSSILLEVANRLEPRPSTVVVHGAFTTTRAILVDKGYIEPNERDLYPDVWNGLENIRALLMPSIVVHSPNDQTIKFSMGEELAAAAGENGTFLTLGSPGHNAVYQIPTDDTWGPVLELLR
jgi:predicted alpha/beta hydrolase family esterase